MPYRRPMHGTTKFMPPPGGTDKSNTTGYGNQGNYINVPMPNETDKNYYGSVKKKKASGLPGILNFLKQHINIEELILISLIILVMDESIEDDFLLIILIYVLLF